MIKSDFKKRLAAYVRQRMRGRALYTKQSRDPLYVSTKVSFVKNGIVRKADIAVYQKAREGKIMPFAVFYVASSSELEEAKAKAKDFVDAYGHKLLEVFVFDCEKMKCCIIRNNTQDSYSKVLGVNAQSIFKGIRLVGVFLLGTCEDDEENDTYIGMATPKWSHDTAIDKLKMFLHFKDERLKNVIKSEYLVLGPNAGTKAHYLGMQPDVFVSKAIDISKVDAVPYIIIEIDHSLRMSAMRSKMRKYMEIYKPSNSDPADSNKRLLEYYIYNYETDVWESFGPNADPERPSYSKMLDADLNDAFRGKAKVVYEF